MTDHVNNLEKVDALLAEVEPLGFKYDRQAKLRDAREVLRLTVEQLRAEQIQSAKAKQQAINLLAYLRNVQGTHPSAGHYDRLNPEERKAITNTITMLEEGNDAPTT